MKTISPIQSGHLAAPADFRHKAGYMFDSPRFYVLSIQALPVLMNVLCSVLSLAAEISVGDSKALKTDVHSPAPDVVTGPWMPKTNSEVADCSLFVHVSNGIDEYGSSNAAWEGTAFLCNQGGVTYIYSNAHNFDGASKFTIKGQDDKQYDDFESIEIASEGCGLWKETRLGGDVVRIRLKNFREKALTIDPLPVTESNAKGHRILITGNAGGRGRITELEGIITEIAEDHIIKHNAATEEGNSGSPMVDLTTHKVVGILTWGANLPNALQLLWMKKPVEVRQGINIGAGLATISFKPTSIEQLYRQREVMNKLKKDDRLLGLLDTLVPTKEGLFVDKMAIVMNDYTVDDLLMESSDHPVVIELVKLDKYLRGRANRNIGISNQDMLKAYVEIYRKCLMLVTDQRKGIENARSATFFMKCEMKQSNMMEVIEAYETLSARCLNWYVLQTGTGGKALPLAQRFRLPAFRSGLEGLGIKEK